MQSTEEWRPVVGYEGSYAVSNLGRVMSLPRTYMRRGHAISVRARVLRTYGAYPMVSLRKDGRTWTPTVHVLVATAFFGPRPEGMDVCHMDGDKRNNRADNLRWGSRSSNILDQVAHGVHGNARKTHCKYGHEFTAENTIARKDGRECRECASKRKRDHHLRNCIN